MEAAKKATSDAEIVSLIEIHGLVRECIPTQFLNSPKVWGALLNKMPMTAMIRNLGKLSAVGVVSPMNDACRLIHSRLTDAEYIQKSRIHPFSVLLALKTYSMGRGFRGSLSWTVDRSILEGLNEAYHLAFENVEPTGKRFFFGIDVSGSMGATINNTNVSCREAAAAVAMASIRVEPWTYAVGFTSGPGGGWRSGDAKLTELGLSKNDSLQSVVNKTSRLQFGGTDCALPMLHAMKNDIQADVFVVITDNETWAGNIHPSQALVQYRQKTGINAKLIVIGMTATKFTIADPNDAGMLDIAGFDASGPKLIAEFAKA